MEASINLNLENEILKGTEVSTNVKQQIIVVPKDRAKLVLKDYEAQQKGRVDWASSIALVITFLAALLTTDFNKDVLGLDKNIWHALFVLLLIVSSGWCIYNIYAAATQKCKSVDAVVEELRDNEMSDATNLQIEDLPRFKKWLVKKLIK